MINCIPITLIPNAWTETLTKVQMMAPEAVIAGGALRDLHLKRPIKDVDIFVQWGSDVKENLEFALKGTLGVVLHPVASYENPGDFGDLVSVYSYTDEGGINYEIIAVREIKSIDHIASRMDFGLCQIAFDGKVLYTTQAFHDDVVSEAITLVSCENSYRYNRAFERYERLLEKFPGWRLVIPPFWRQVYGTDEVDILG